MDSFPYRTSPLLNRFAPLIFYSGFILYSGAFQKDGVFCTAEEQQPLQFKFLDLFARFN